MTSPLESFAAAAVQAPSGDNTQPWRLEIAPAAERILLHVDETPARADKHLEIIHDRFLPCKIFKALRTENAFKLLVNGGEIGGGGI